MNRFCSGLTKAKKLLVETATKPQKIQIQGAKIFGKEAYSVYAAMTKDEAQNSRWVFYGGAIRIRCCLAF